MNLAAEDRLYDCHAARTVRTNWGRHTSGALRLRRRRDAHFVEQVGQEFVVKSRDDRTGHLTHRRPLPAGYLQPPPSLSETASEVVGGGVGDMLADVLTRDKAAPLHLEQVIPLQHQREE